MELQMNVLFMLMEFYQILKTMDQLLIRIPQTQMELLFR